MSFLTSERSDDSGGLTTMSGGGLGGSSRGSPDGQSGDASKAI